MVPGTATPSLVQMPEAIKRELYEYPARIPSVAVAEAERAQKPRLRRGEYCYVQSIETTKAPAASVTKKIAFGARQRGAW